MGKSPTGPAHRARLRGSDRHQCLSAVGKSPTDWYRLKSDSGRVVVTNAFRLWVNPQQRGMGIRSARRRRRHQCLSAVGKSPTASASKNDCVFRGCHQCLSAVGKSPTHGARREHREPQESVTNAFRLWVNPQLAGMGGYRTGGTSCHQCLSAVGKSPTYHPRLTSLVLSSSHQCLSAVGKSPTRNAGDGIRQGQKRSPMPFGCG